jgi:hypothetical protein
MNNTTTHQATKPIVNLIARGGLTNDEIISLALAAGTDDGTHAAGASHRYRSVSTLRLIESARDAGFIVTNASQPTGSKHDPFAKHRIDMVFAPNGISEGVEGLPSAVFINSHDRTKALTAIAGYFRLVCENGLIISDGPTVKMRSLHLGDALHDLPRYVADAAAMLAGTHALIEPMQERKTSPVERSVFAALVMETRWKGYPKTPVTPKMLLEPRRAEDEGDDLWRVMNRVQENVIRGEVTGVTGRKTTGVKSFYANLTVNKAVWGAAETLLSGGVSHLNKARKQLELAN